MNALQERRLILAALDFADADRECRKARVDPTRSRKNALRLRRLAKQRLLTAARHHESKNWRRQ